MDYEMMVKEAYEEIMGFDKEAGDYSRDNGLGMAQQSAIKRIAGAPNKDAVMSKLSAGRRKFLDQADKLKSQYDKANNAYTDLINRGAKNAPATDILKNKLFSLGNQYESAQNKAMNLHYMGRRIRDYRVKEAYEEIMGIEKL